MGTKIIARGEGGGGGRVTGRARKMACCMWAQVCTRVVLCCSNEGFRKRRKRTISAPVLREKYGHAKKARASISCQFCWFLLYFVFHAPFSRSLSQTPVPVQALLATCICSRRVLIPKSVYDTDREALPWESWYPS